VVEDVPVAEQDRDKSDVQEERTGEVAAEILLGCVAS
jgi:hypothetical protein